MVPPCGPGLGERELHAVLAVAPAQNSACLHMLSVPRTGRALLSRRAICTGPSQSWSSPGHRVR